MMWDRGMTRRARERWKRLDSMMWERGVFEGVRGVACLARAV